MSIIWGTVCVSYLCSTVHQCTQIMRNFWPRRESKTDELRGPRCYGWLLCTLCLNSARCVTIILNINVLIIDERVEMKHSSETHSIQVQYIADIPAKGAGQ